MTKKNDTAHWNKDEREKWAGSQSLHPLPILFFRHCSFVLS